VCLGSKTAWRKEWIIANTPRRSSRRRNVTPKAIDTMLRPRLKGPATAPPHMTVHATAPVTASETTLE
jgi:hypothetical protein